MLADRLKAEPHVLTVSEGSKECRAIARNNTGRIDEKEINGTAEGVESVVQAPISAATKGGQLLLQAFAGICEPR